MSTVKTAISIRRPLFEQVENLARELRMSRSRIVALALDEFLKRHRALDLVRQLDAAHDAPPTPAETALARRRRQAHRSMVEGEW